VRVPQRRTTPGKLSDAARHVILPSGIVATGWPAVRDTCAGFGVAFDAWQDGAGRVILAKRDDGSYACSIGGVVISIPRQVGKTFLVGAIVFALCLLYPGLTVLWTAHRLRTAAETFGKMQAFAARKKVKPHVANVYVGSGDEEIKFHNGSRILFGARERGFGRGFDDVDVEVFDEAQILTENAIDDMVPATNTAKNPLLIFMGTPPKPSDPSEVFTTKRATALSGDDEDIAYIEFSADRGCDPMDRKQWGKGNPSVRSGRTPEAAMLRMIKNLSVDSFVREGLGIWDEVAHAAATLIESDQWDLLEVEAAPADGVVGYGVKFSPDGMSVALSAAIKPGGGAAVHVEGIEHRPIIDGTRWLVEWLRTRKARVAIDGKAGAGALESALLRAGVPAKRVHRPTVDEVITAHAAFVNGVGLGEVSHLDDPALAASIASAGRRPIGNLGGWGFQAIDDGDVTLAESVVLAHWVASQVPKRTGAVIGVR
jgi:hypothetical protein